MCNTGRFIDRSPTLNPAGKNTYQKEESVGRCLLDLNTEYNSDELEKPKTVQVYPLPPLRGDQHAGFYTKMRSVMQAPPKSIFKGLLEEFQETRYDSFWNKPLGRGRDFVPGLPPSIDPEINCFGIKTDGGNNIGELLNPKKSKSQVITESEIGHDLYVKSHKDYYPGEQIDRKYDSQKINKNLIYGEVVPHDNGGILVREAMKWRDSDDIGDIQKKFMERNNRNVGEPFAPNKNIENLPKGHRFGKTTNNEDCAADSMKEYSSSLEKKHLIDALRIINALRLALSKRSPPFPFRDLLATFQFRDKELTGFLCFESVYEIFMLFHIMISQLTLNTLCKTMNLINENNLIDYKKLIDVINSQNELPEVDKFEDIPNELLLYKSEYQDHYDPINIGKGKKSKIYNDDKLTGENNVYELITPSIYTQYGLSSHDFFKSCSKETMEKFFKSIDIQIPKDKFHTIWNSASKQDKLGRVSLNTFTEELKVEMPELLITF